MLLVPNAANTAEVVRRLQAAAPDGVSVKSHHDEYAVLAVQGDGASGAGQQRPCPVEHPGPGQHISVDHITWTCR